ncbi:TPA: hypothetical protein ACYEOW_003636 [Raoultella terrigena]
MLDHKTLEQTLIAAAEMDGGTLNGHDRLVIRTKVATALAAKGRYRQRMDAAPFQWRKPQPPKR